MTDRGDRVVRAGFTLIMAAAALSVQAEESGVDEVAPVLQAMEQAEISHVQARRALERRLEIEQLEAQIAKARAEKAAAEKEAVGPQPEIPAPVAEPSKAAPPPPPPPPPRVLAVEGGTVRLAMGQMVLSARKGDVLPGGYRVRRVLWSGAELEAPDGSVMRVAVQW